MKYKFESYEDMIASDEYRRMCDPQKLADYAIACSFKGNVDPNDWKAVYGCVKKQEKIDDKRKV